MGQAVDIQNVKFIPIGAHFHYAPTEVAGVVDLLARTDKPQSATMLMLQCCSGAIKYTLDGSNPVGGSHGFVLQSKQAEPVVGFNPPVIFSILGLTNLKISEEITNATLDGQWGKS